MSPSKSSSTALAFRCSVPTWTAMSCEPCMIVSPRASCSAHEKSREKITNEWQVRRICSAISSTTVTNEFLSTSKVTGSSPMSAGLHPDVEPLVDLGPDAGRYERGRVELVDHRGALEPDPGGQVPALVDRRVVRLAVEVHRAGLDRVPQGAVPRLLARELDLLGLARGHELQPVELDRRVVAAVGELALVLGVEAPHGRVEIAVEGHLQRAPLAQVAHRDRALQSDAVRADALGGQQLAAV